MRFRWFSVLAASVISISLAAPASRAQYSAGDWPYYRGDLAGQGRLVADPRRQAAKQPRHLTARLHQPIHVIDQQQHILVRHVAEMLGDRERRQPGAPAGTRRFVHLAENTAGERRQQRAAALSHRCS